MQHPPPALWLILIFLAVLSGSMIFAMVQFSRALIFAPGDPRARRLWGAAYVLAWAGIVAGFLWMLHIGRAMTRHNVTILVLVGGFWWGMHAMLIAVARLGMRRVQEVSYEHAEPEAEVRAAAIPREPVPSGFGQRLRGLARTVVTLVIVLIVIGICEAIPGMQRLKATIDAHRYPLLPIAMAAGILGTLALAGGGAAMALRFGRPMTRDQINRLSADVRMRRPGGFVFRRAIYRHFGDAAGLTASDEVSLAELKHAWRTRAWRVSPRWRIIFIMVLGAALMALGIWGTFVVVAPAGIKFLVTLAFGYALVRVVWAVWRC